MSPLKRGFVFALVIVVSGGLSSRGDLQFDATKKTFKIAQLTDLHWEVTELDNQDSLDVMANVLDAEHPDLVVLTGDMVPTKDATLNIWKKVVKVVQDRGIPWVVTLGNHDREAMTAQEVISGLTPLDYSVLNMGSSVVQMSPSGIGGAGNCLLTIKNSTGQRNAAAIYCLDSQVSGLWGTQVQWFRDQSAAVTQANGGRPLPGLAFFHIPLPEFNYYGTGQVNRQIGYPQGESPDFEDQNSAMFDAIQDTRGVMGVFVGHDHNNDFALFFDEVCLAYGQKTGVNSYGSLPKGGRIIQLTEGMPGFDSWIRIGDGSTFDSWLPHSGEHGPTGFFFHYEPVSVVPEPSSLVMLVLALAGLIWLGRRRTI